MVTKIEHHTTLRNGDYIDFLFGFSFGVLLFAVTSGITAGKTLHPRSIFLKVRRNVYHVHHWIIFSLFLLCTMITLYLIDIEHTSVYLVIWLGFCCGSIFHGLYFFSDRFNILVDKIDGSYIS